jgi:hypothetical protein
MKQKTHNRMPSKQYHQREKQGDRERKMGSELKPQYREREKEGKEGGREEGRKEERRGDEGE